MDECSERSINNARKIKANDAIPIHPDSVQLSSSPALPLFNTHTYFPVWMHIELHCIALGRLANQTTRLLNITNRDICDMDASMCKCVCIQCRGGVQMFVSYGQDTHIHFSWSLVCNPYAHTYLPRRSNELCFCFKTVEWLYILGITNRI